MEQIIPRMSFERIG